MACQGSIFGWHRHCPWLTHRWLGCFEMSSEFSLSPPVYFAYPCTGLGALLLVWFSDLLKCPIMLLHRLKSMPWTELGNPESHSGWWCPCRSCVCTSPRNRLMVLCTSWWHLGASSWIRTLEGDVAHARPSESGVGCFMHSMEESHKDYERAIGNSDLRLLHGLLSWSVSPPPLDFVSFLCFWANPCCVCCSRCIWGSWLPC